MSGSLIQPSPQRADVGQLRRIRPNRQTNQFSTGDLNRAVKPADAFGAAAKVSLSPEAVSAMEKQERSGAPKSESEPTTIRERRTPRRDVNTAKPEPEPRKTVAPPSQRADQTSPGTESDRAERQNETGEQGQSAQASAAQKGKGPGLRQLSSQEQAVVRQLQARDAEVRAHEGAHVAAAGGSAGSPSFSYQEGPDGKRYAVGGEVGIAISGGSTPEETIANAQQVRRAALAPAQPSGQDRAVAAAAGQMEAQALKEQAAEKTKEMEELVNGGGEKSPDAGKAGSTMALGENPLRSMLKGSSDGVKSLLNGLEEPQNGEDRFNPDAGEKSGGKNTIFGYGGERADGQKGHAHEQTECPYCKSSIAKYTGG